MREIARIDGRVDSHKPTYGYRWEQGSCPSALDHEERIVKLEKIGDLDTKLAGDLTALDGKVTGLAGDYTTLERRVGLDEKNLDDYKTSNDARVTTLEGILKDDRLGKLEKSVGEVGASLTRWLLLRIVSLQRMVSRSERKQDLVLWNRAGLPAAALSKELWRSRRRRSPWW